MKITATQFPIIIQTRNTSRQYGQPTENDNLTAPFDQITLAVGETFELAQDERLVNVREVTPVAEVPFDLAGGPSDASSAE